MTAPSTLVDFAYGEDKDATTDYMPVYTASVDGTGAKVTLNKTVKNAATLKDLVDDLDDKGVTVQVISNDGDSKIDMMVIYDQTFAKLTAANSSSLTYRAVKADMSGDTTATGAKLDIEDDEPTVYEDYKKDDYVFVSADLFNDAVVVEKAETVTGEAAAVKDDSIKIEDTWYDYIGGDFNAKAGEKYTAYVLNGFAYYVEGASATDVDTLLVM